MVEREIFSRWVEWVRANACSLCSVRGSPQRSERRLNFVILAMSLSEGPITRLTIIICQHDWWRGIAVIEALRMQWAGKNFPFARPRIDLNQLSHTSDSAMQNVRTIGRKELTLRCPVQNFSCDYSELHGCQTNDGLFVRPLFSLKSQYSELFSRCTRPSRKAKLAPLL